MDYNEQQKINGTKGGKATVAKHGNGHMKKISKLAAKARKQQRGK